MSYKKYIAAIIVLFSLGACKSEPEPWVRSPGLEVHVFKDQDEENGKPYLTIMYENFGNDTIEKIRFQLIRQYKGQQDTTWREIDPPKLLRPKDRHIVPRQIGEDTLAADYVSVGQILAVKMK